MPRRNIRRPQLVHTLSAKARLAIMLVTSFVVAIVIAVVSYYAGKHQAIS